VLPFLFPHTALETPTYYVLFLLGLLGAIILGTRRAQTFHLSPVRVVDFGITVFVAGVAGARIFHIFFEAPDYYLAHPIRVFYLWQGGFVLYGGILFGILAGYLFLKYLKEPIGAWGDLTGPCVFLGIAIGRMACLAAGCCHGSVTDWSWGMIFTDPRSAAPLHVPLHPTQALEMIFTFLLAMVFHKFVKGPTRMSGSSFVWMLILYSIFRFAIEFLRGDLDRGVYAGGSISTSQIVSMAVVLGCIVWFALMKLNASRKSV